MVKDIKILEKVQRRMIKQIPNIKGTYEEKLSKLGLQDATRLNKKATLGILVLWHFPFVKSSNIYERLKAL